MPSRQRVHAQAAALRHVHNTERWLRNHLPEGAPTCAVTTVITDQ